MREQDPTPAKREPHPASFMPTRNRAEYRRKLKRLGGLPGFVQGAGYRKVRSLRTLGLHPAQVAAKEATE